jgi:Domain of unknown function (DUF4397)
VAVLSLCGCETVSGSHPVTLVRVIDASYHPDAYDAYIGSTPIAVNFAGPSVSNYAFQPPGVTTVNIVPTGKHNVVAQVMGTLLASQQHSVYITDQGADITATLLTDQNVAGPGGAVSLRFLQQATSTGPVDIYLVPDGTKIADAKPLFSALAPGMVTSYLNVPPGNYDVLVAVAGTVTMATTYTSPAMDLTAGQVRTMLIVDQQLLVTPPVNVIVANDLN